MLSTAYCSDVLRVAILATHIGRHYTTHFYHFIVILCASLSLSLPRSLHEYIRTWREAGGSATCASWCHAPPLLPPPLRPEAGESPMAGSPASPPRPPGSRPSPSRPPCAGLRTCTVPRCCGVACRGVAGLRCLSSVVISRCGAVRCLLMPWCDVLGVGEINWCIWSI